MDKQTPTQIKCCECGVTDLMIWRNKIEEDEQNRIIEIIIGEKLKAEECNQHTCKLKLFDDEDICLPCFEVQCYKELLQKIKGEHK